MVHYQKKIRKFLTWDQQNEQNREVCSHSWVADTKGKSQHWHLKPLLCQNKKTQMQNKCLIVPPFSWVQCNTTQMHIHKFNFISVGPPDPSFWIIYIPFKLLFSPNKWIFPKSCIFRNVSKNNSRKMWVKTIQNPKPSICI